MNISKRVKSLVGGLAAFAVCTTGLAFVWSAPAHAATDTPKLEQYLGGYSRYSDGPDEFRADFVVRVPGGERPKQVRYSYYPNNPTYRINLNKVADVQTSIDQAYDIVAVTADGEDDLLYISARGDSDVATLPAHQQFPQKVELTFESGKLEFDYKVDIVTRSGNKGRPVALSTWDHTTSGLKGYVGPNSQAGWGNAVYANEDRKLNGGLFSVDAITSGRSSSAGCDVTDSLYYQFVRGDNGAPASVTPQPVKLAIPSHSDFISVKGQNLAAELGDFVLDDPGYYKLLVWPQAKSSSTKAPQDCSGVSWDPSDPAQATQVGSVFWKYENRHKLVEVLGDVNRYSDGPDEFRADFVVSVPRGEEPDLAQYNYYPSNKDPHWKKLYEIDNVQKSVDQHYQIVAKQRNGADDLIAISARGDSDVPTYKEHRTIAQGINLEFPSGGTRFDYEVDLQTRTGNIGRPIATSVWDWTTKHRPGYVGPNSQTGWGNVVLPDENKTLDGGLFSVDAISSNRSSNIGCDITDAVYYQFVRGDDGTPASITPEPKLLKIKHHSDFISVYGETLAAELGKFELDDPGYYKLLAWPQAKSSKAGAPQDCSAVSWNPADLTQATQVGSVFWKYDFGSKTVSLQDTKLSVSTGVRRADEVHAHTATVTVLNKNQKPLSGVEVEFTGTGGVAFSSDKAVSNEDGVVTVTITSFTPGAKSISAKIAGKEVTGSPATVRFIEGPPTAPPPPPIAVEEPSSSEDTATGNESQQNTKPEVASDESAESDNSVTE